MQTAKKASVTPAVSTSTVYIATSSSRKDCPIPRLLLQLYGQQLHKQLCFRRKGLMSNIGSTSIVSLFLCLYGYIAVIFWLEVTAKAWGLGLSFCSVLVQCPPEPWSLVEWVGLPHLTIMQSTVIINSNLKNNQ